MTKQDFLAAIAAELKGLPPADIDRSLDFYAEMIDDRTEEGLSEEEAVAALGPIGEIAAQILMATPLPKLVKAKARPGRRLRVWEIVLLALGFPLWFPLLLTAAILILTIYLLLWVVIATLYAADACLAACLIGGLFGGAVLLITGYPAQGLLCWGAALVCGGLAVAFFPAINQATKGVVLFGRWFLRCIKKIFIGKGDTK